MKSGTSSPRLAAATLAIALAAHAATPALRAQPADPGLTESSPVMARFTEGLHDAMAEYWTPRLNGYKAAIDDLLAPDDLAELNRLRVRWAILSYDYATRKREGKPIQGDPNSSVATDGYGAFTEAMNVYDATIQIAARNRSRLDPLGTVVIKDFGGSIDRMAALTGDFMERNRGAIESDTTARRRMKAALDVREGVAKLGPSRFRKDFEAVYGMAFEPFVLLYDGAEMDKLLQTGGRDLTGIASITGIGMSAASALKQNFPNPASARTTIPYTISAASTSTIIRVFNAVGDLVATYDQGPRAAGEHALDIDVAALPSGTYLYHLTLQTPDGQRVYSKVMQVVR